MSIKLQMLGGGRAGGPPPCRGRRALPFFLRHVLTRLDFFLLPPRAANPHALLEDSCPPFPADGAPRERGGGAGSGLWPLPRALGLLEGLSLFAGWHGGIPENSPEILAGDSWYDLEHTPSAPLRPAFFAGQGGLKEMAAGGLFLGARREQGQQNHKHSLGADSVPGHAWAQANLLNSPLQ